MKRRTFLVSAALAGSGTLVLGFRALVEFPSLARAHEWYDSPEYAEALELRAKALRRRLIFVEGVAGESIPS